MPAPVNTPSTRPVALITGAGRASGIGFEAARQLAQQGFTVVLSARDQNAALARAAELQAQGLDVVGRGLDVADAAAVQALLPWLTGRWGRLDVLVNNAAGVSAYGEQAASADLTAAHAVIETTLFGSWHLAQALLPLLRQSPQGRIVNVSSGAGSHGDTAFGLNTGNGMGTSYAVAKAALNALTVKLAREEKTAADGRRVLINAVCPGFTATFEGGQQMGARPVAEGAASVVWAALLPADGPSGGFFRDGRPLAW
jgi:NAD(P)-dependent dehydrogenase (short-subunit alcohol dehydrogenase family)